MMYFQDFRGKTSDWAVGRLLQPLGLRQPGPSTNFSQMRINMIKNFIEINFLLRFIFNLVLLKVLHFSKIWLIFLRIRIQIAPLNHLNSLSAWTGQSALTSRVLAPICLEQLVTSRFIYPLSILSFLDMSFNIFFQNLESLKSYPELWAAIFVDCYS